ncbi:MAG TPA: zinc ABC transporter substrate-binding protein [bacterium]|nr:zinc ABC transporter substrate-binding protein [bacterium]
MKMTRVRSWQRGALAGVTALLVIGLAWAGAGSSASAARPLRVVATTTQVTDFARIVAGNAAQVVGILPANVDPHDYEAVPGDLQKLSSADLLVENGAGMEDAWMVNLLQSVHRRVRVVDTSRGISLLPGSRESPRGDPHIWFAVPNAAQMVANIRDAMAQADPANAAYYRANAARYVPQLDALDKYIFAQIATLPRAERKLVTSHDAFSYYVTRYGLTLVGAVIPSTNTEAEVSAQHLAQLVRVIRSERVKAIFLETSVNPKVEEQIGQEAGVRVVTNLYGDTLGPAGSDGDTYLRMMRHNTDLIVSSLR